MRTRPPVFKPLQREPIEFRGGPMDGQVIEFNPPLQAHVFWKNRNGTYEVYLLERDLSGWSYRFEPNAEIEGRPRFPLEPGDIQSEGLG